MIKKTKTTLPKKYNRVNIAGINIKRIRKEKYPDMSQNGLATQLQLQGIAINKNAIQLIVAKTKFINGPANDTIASAFSTVIFLL